MTVQNIACPSCQAPIKAGPQLQGKKVRCPKCQEIFVVPGAAAAPAAAGWYVGRGKEKLGPFTTAKLKKMAADGEITAADNLRRDGTKDWVTADSVKGLFPPPEPVAAAEEYGEDDRPAPKSKKSSKPERPAKKGGGMLWLLVGAGAFGFLLLIGGAVGLWYMFGSGNGKTIDQAAYDRIRSNMTEQDVVAILGSPTESSDAHAISKGHEIKTRILTWTQGKNQVFITFIDEKATKIQGSFRDANGVVASRSGFGPNSIAQGQPPGAPPGTSPSQPATIIGTWVVTSYASDGIENKGMVGWKYTFEPDGHFSMLEVGAGGVTIHGTYKHDAAAKPMVLDLKESNFLFSGVGICEINGDTLKLCQGTDKTGGGQRPTTFKSGAGVVLVTMKVTAGQTPTTADPAKQQVEDLNKQLPKLVNDLTDSFMKAKDEQEAMAKAREFSQTLSSIIAKIEASPIPKEDKVKIRDKYGSEWTEAQLRFNKVSQKYPKAAMVAFEPLAPKK